MEDVRLLHAPDGTPYVRPYLGRSPVTGKVVRPYKEFPGMSDDEALAAAREFVTHATDALENGADNSLQGQLMLYLDNAEATSTLARSTIRKYRSYARRYVEPIADMQVQDVSASVIDALARALINDGPSGGKPLARSTVRSFQQFLQGAFNYFVAMELAERNPVKDSMRIRADTPEAEPLDEESFRKVRDWIDRELEAFPDSDLGRLRRNAAMCMSLALKTGMRVGELCALRRKDVRTMQGTISVNGTMPDVGNERQNDTKSHRVRNISITQEDCKAILAHEWWQDGYLAKHNQNTPIFTLDGTHMTPDTMRSQFRRMCRECGLSESCHFHTLRHTHATYLLANGYPMRAVSQRLGHSDVRTTMTIYAHVLPADDGNLARGMGDIWGSL